MGRVWVQQSGARTRLEDARERAAGFRRRRRRSGPGGPSDPDASGRVPGAGHQRPAASRRPVAVLGVARGTGSLTRLRPAVRSPRHRVGGARMNRQELVFEQPRELFASTPIETERGTRDAVRLLLTTPAGNRHATFVELPRFLSAGDLLVGNGGAPLAGSLEAHGPAGTYTLDLSTRYADRLWLAEPRWDAAHPGRMPIQPGEEARVGDATVRYLAPYPGIPRLWFIRSDRPLEPILEWAGVPIHYGYVQKIWPLDAYQSMFSRVPGSAEMPSAARPITPRIEEALEAAGVRFTSVVLHSGVSSLEIETDSVEQQAVYPEPFQVSRSAAEMVNRTREEGHRVVAIGTTVVRALESAWTPDGLRPRQGFTRLFVHPGNPVRSVDGLLTGFHGPDPFRSLFSLLPEVVHVDAARSERFHRLPQLSSPCDVHLVLGRIGPQGRDDQVEPRVPMAERRVPFPDARDRAPQVFEDDRGALRGHALEVTNQGVDRLLTEVREEARLPVVPNPWRIGGRKDSLEVHVRHSFDVIHDGRPELAQRAEDSLAILCRADVARHEEGHGGAVGRGAEGRKQRDLVRCAFDEFPVEPQGVSGSVKRMDRHSAEDRTHRMQSELERCGDAEVAAAAPDAPEQVRILFFAGVHKASVRGDEFDAEEVVTGQAVFPGEKAEPAPESQSGDTGSGNDSTGRREPRGLRRLVEFAPCDAAADDGGAALCVDPDLFQRR